MGAGQQFAARQYNRIERVPNAGWTAYESVFQDPKMWMQSGKQDMIVPMMYYLHDNFFPFVDNWVDNSNGRLVVPGLGAYRMLKEEADWTVNEYNGPDRLQPLLRRSRLHVLPLCECP